LTAKQKMTDLSRTNREFNREEHVYASDAFEEIIKDTIRFFNGTPVLQLPTPVKFHGTGVYAIYYIGKNDVYKSLTKRNRIEFSMPIYSWQGGSKGMETGKN